MRSIALSGANDAEESIPGEEPHAAFPLAGVRRQETPPHFRDDAVADELLTADSRASGVLSEL